MVKTSKTILNTMLSHNEAMVWPFASLPDCHFCLENQDGREAEYDGRTAKGPWAYMCQRHYEIYGVGLGTGNGQMLIPTALIEEVNT